MPWRSGILQPLSPCTSSLHFQKKTLPLSAAAEKFRSEAAAPDTLTGRSNPGELKMGEHKLPKHKAEKIMPMFVFIRQHDIELEAGLVLAGPSSFGA
jgi:hypothetical protein